MASSDNITAIFNIKIDSVLDSGLSICRTVSVCLILIIGAMVFYKDADLLIVRPIEKLMSIIKTIIHDPLGACRNEGDESLVPVTSKRNCCCKENKQENEYEMLLIKNDIEKISILLALGFGEAGSAIISSNMIKTGKLDTILQGVKIVGIFALCDIRNFTDTTEELQEEIMTFVNEIARIVHGIVDKYLGAANKNIGDAFLVV